MAKRTSQQVVMIEYAPTHRDRTSQQLVMVEFSPLHKDRTSQMLVMVEYSSAPTAPTGRVFGPAAQSS